MNFLQSDSTREHFRSEYGFELEAFMIEAKRDSNKNPVPSALRAFVENESKNELCFLVINSAMLSSDSLKKGYDDNLFDEFDNAFDALSALNVVCIVDEPHLFRKTNEAWKRIQASTNKQDFATKSGEKAINPQLIFRFGASFYDEGKHSKKGLEFQGKYENLLYVLNAIDAFNQNLIKGIEISICKSEGNERQEYVELLEVDEKSVQARFALKVKGQKNPLKEVILRLDESLRALSEGLLNLKIKNITRKKELLLNNDDILYKKGDRIYLSDYLPQMQQAMLKTALERHFDLEEKLLNEECKIKPLCLFFIDDINSYRSDNAKNETLRNEFEKLAKHIMQEKLQRATGFYKRYLEQSLMNLKGLSGGYFAKDKKDKEEMIANEVREILHDKEALLSLNNVRRFIFSHRTLGVGWDNPNVFTICKLGVSGSEISKLQEVGRGLRLPVNEYMSRDTKEHFLQYIVNDTQEDLARALVREINEKSGVIFSDDMQKLSEEMLEKLCELIKLSKFKMMNLLVKEGIINEDLQFLNGGISSLKALYPQLFDKKLQENKIRNKKDLTKLAHLRKNKYKELKALWELINQRVVLEYKFTSEAEFKGLLKDFLREFLPNAIKNEIIVQSEKMTHTKDLVGIQKGFNALTSVDYQAINKDEFVQKAALALLVNINTLRGCLAELEINEKFYNPHNINELKKHFNDFLFENALSKFEVSFCKLSSKAHPTVFTNKEGEALNTVKLNFGTMQTEGKTPSSYLFEEIFYDSKIEKNNILSDIKEVKVFTKIPKNALKIPAAGGFSYTPDFAYILDKKNEDGKELCCIIESKGKKDLALSGLEKGKIKAAREFFKLFEDAKMAINYQTQFDEDSIRIVLEKFFLA
ncbi:type III restriction-modification system endonuclease [Campylobacter troglodytis]|uniref:type III restriction-modification system endonuclease n=1 Tax=Campylobacter troglodytis TaxID=654363 RepID=UPI001FE5BD7E|nr:type III restriction-modification system endonuclease [Campylobacter troglodytis]